MFEHPLTEKHLQTVREVLKYNVVGPISKGLACGDVGKQCHCSVCTFLLLLKGQGAMTEWKDIVNMIVEKFSLKPKH